MLCGAVRSKLGFICGVNYTLSGLTVVENAMFSGTSDLLAAAAAANAAVVVVAVLFLFT